MTISIIVLCLVAVFSAVFVVTHQVKNTILDGPDMKNNAYVISVEYYKGGDEYDRSVSISMSDEQITYYKNEGTLGGKIEKSCALPAGFHDALEDIVTKYDLKSWRKLSPSDIQVLDGATTSMTIRFADEVVVELGDSFDMPNDAWKAVSEIHDLLESALESEGTQAK